MTAIVIFKPLQWFFLKKLKFWKKRKANVSPTMVNGVSTVGPGKCDVGTMTEYVIVGSPTNLNAAQALEHAERWESYSNGARPAEHVGWCEFYTHEGCPSCIQRTKSIHRQSTIYIQPQCTLCIQRTICTRGIQKVKAIFKLRGNRDR